MRLSHLIVKHCYALPCGPLPAPIVGVEDAGNVTSCGTTEAQRCHSEIVEKTM
jgi:hypothetical protein